MRPNSNKSTLSFSPTEVSNVDTKFEDPPINKCERANIIELLPEPGDCSFYAKYVFQAMFGETLAKNGGFITFGDYARALSSLLRGTIEEKIR